MAVTSDGCGASMQGTDRRQPVQPRAQRTVRKVLDATLEILVTDSLPGLNTNRIAKQAGVNISTLYSYFPDKLSIVRQLAAEFETKRGDYIAGRAHLLSTIGWREWYDDIIDRLVRFRLEEPGAVALRRAINSSPDLKYLDDASTDRAAELAIPGLMALTPNLSKGTARTIALLISVTVTTGLDHAFESEPYGADEVVELKTMVRSYLDARLG